MVIIKKLLKSYRKQVDSLFFLINIMFKQQLPYRIGNCCFVLLKRNGVKYI